MQSGACFCQTQAAAAVHCKAQMLGTCVSCEVCIICSASVSVHASAVFGVIMLCSDILLLKTAHVVTSASVQYTCSCPPVSWPHDRHAHEG